MIIENEQSPTKKKNQQLSLAERVSQQTKEIWDRAERAEEKELMEFYEELKRERKC